MGVLPSDASFADPYRLNNRRGFDLAGFLEVLDLAVVLEGGCYCSEKGRTEGVVDEESDVGGAGFV